MVSTPAVCLALAIATLCEIAAYYIPWVDNAIDTIVTPAAILAGTLTTMAASSGEMSQFAAWAAAIIVGGGTAGAVQMSSVAARGLQLLPQAVLRIRYSQPENGSELFCYPFCHYFCQC